VETQRKVAARGNENNEIPIPGRGWEFFSSPSRPDRLSLLSSGYQGFFPLA